MERENKHWLGYDWEHRHQSFLCTMYEQNPWETCVQTNTLQERKFICQHFRLYVPLFLNTSEYIETYNKSSLAINKYSVWRKMILVIHHYEQYSRFRVWLSFDRVIQQIISIDIYMSCRENSKLTVKIWTHRIAVLIYETYFPFDEFS
jgi:hypothetical protein